MKKRRMAKWIPAALIVSLGLLGAGCTQVEPNNDSQPSASSPSVQTDQAEPKKVESVSDKQVMQDSKKEAIAVASPQNNDNETAEGTKASSEASSDTAPLPTPNKRIEINEKFNPSKPQLMGLSLNDRKEDVERLFGKPSDTFSMDEEGLLVYQYSGFAVGFGSNGRITFVEVQSDAVNPGLGGLKLMQKTADALRTLGKPNANTNYVLSYKGGSAILRLDIDPKTDTIQSIKLFADE